MLRQAIYAHTLAVHYEGACVREFLYSPPIVDSRVCSKKQKPPTEDVHGRRTLAEGANQCIFAYGVGSSMVGVIPSPQLGS